MMNHIVDVWRLRAENNDRIKYLEDFRRTESNEKMMNNCQLRQHL